MAFINTIPAQNAVGDVKELYERQQGPYGYVPNYAKVFCHRPDVMTAWAVLQKAIKRDMDTKSYELATFAAAQSIGSSYCSLAHGKTLQNKYYSEEQLVDIAKGNGDQILSAREQAVMLVARKVAENSSTVTAQDITALKEHGLDSAAIFDVVATAAARCFFAKLVDGLGALPDSDFLAMDESVRELLTVGRPVSTKRSEMIN
jgi:uncharacterized peroxidase-related enzyme